MILHMESFRLQQEQATHLTVGTPIQAALVLIMHRAANTRQMQM